MNHKIDLYGKSLASAQMEIAKLTQERDTYKEALEDIESMRGDGSPGNAIICTSAPGLMRRAERALAQFAPCNCPSQLVVEKEK